MLRPSPRDGIWFIVIRFEYAIHGLCRDSSKGAQVGRSDEERYEERGQNVPCQWLGESGELCDKLVGLLMI